MIKLIKLILYIILLLFAFLAGVHYSSNTKEIANWLFEAKEQELEFEEIEKDLKSNQEKPIETPANPIDNSIDNGIENNIIIHNDTSTEIDIAPNPTPDSSLKNE